MLLLYLINQFQFHLEPYRLRVNASMLLDYHCLLVLLLLAEMEHQICEGKTDQEMMKFFGMKHRSFYYFKDKLYKQSLALQTANKTSEVIAFETRVKERLTKVYQHLEERLAMMNRDPTINTDDMANLAIATYQIAKNIMQLELEGLRVLSSTYENRFLKNARVYQDYYSNSPNNHENSNTNLLQP